MSEIDLMDYTPKEDDIFNDDDIIYEIKEAIQLLRPVERQIFLMYTELGTYTETAKRYNVSPATLKSYITGVRNKISRIVNGEVNNDNSD